MFHVDPELLFLSVFRLNHFLLSKKGIRNFSWNPRWHLDRTRWLFLGLSPQPQHLSPQLQWLPSPRQWTGKERMVWLWCQGFLTCLVMRLFALLTAFVSMTTPGGALDATATWAKVVRAAQKVGAWGSGWGHGGDPAGSQRAILQSTRGSFLSFS